MKAEIIIRSTKAYDSRGSQQWWAKIFWPYRKDHSSVKQNEMMTRSFFSEAGAIRAARTFLKKMRMDEHKFTVEPFVGDDNDK